MIPTKEQIEQEAKTFSDTWEVTDEALAAEAGFIAGAEWAISQNSANAMLGGAKPVQVCPRCNRSNIAWNVAGTRYRCIYCGDEGKTCT